jgi:glycosyltransferase involved in cell wall biosynthesis
VISNGYDPEELANVEPHDFGHFAIVYTGLLWPPRRVISPVMAALRRMDETANGKALRWRFHYYGRHGDHVREEADRFRVTERVAVHGEVPRRQALAAVKGAGVAVVITSVAESPTTEDNGMVTGKIFEAIGLGTPTVLIAPPASDARTVAEPTGFVRGFSASDIDGIGTFLTRLIDGHSLELKSAVAYTWGKLIERFDRVLCEIIEGRARKN